MISFVSYDFQDRINGYLASSGKNSAFTILVLHLIIPLSSMAGCKQVNLLPVICTLAKLSSCVLLMNQSSASFTSDGRSSPTIFPSTDLLMFFMNQITQPQILISFFHDEWCFGFSPYGDGVSNCITFDIMTT